MTNKNLLKYFLLFVLFVCNISYGQIVKRWVIIYDGTEKIVYIDTTSIQKNNERLSLWAMTKYREAIDIQPFQKKVSRVKSNVLFNTYTRMYSIIGAIYYDNRGRIVGESNNPQFGNSRNLYTNKLEEGTTYSFALDKAEEYLDYGTITPIVVERTVKTLSPSREYKTPSISSKTNQNSNPSRYANIDSGDSIKYTVGYELQKNLDKPLPNDTNIIDNTKKNELTREDTVRFTVGEDLRNQLYEENYKPKQKNEKITTDYLRDSNNNTQLKSYEPAVEKIEPEKKIESKPPPKPVIKKTVPKPKNYNKDSETNISGTIWSDGSLYCYQVSSWRSRKKAESEAARLKNKGHNAFVVKSYVASKGRNYYRVRIGYFDTLSEARESQSQVN